MKFAAAKNCRGDATAGQRRSFEIHDGAFSYMKGFDVRRVDADVYESGFDLQRLFVVFLDKVDGFAGAISMHSQVVNPDISHDQVGRCWAEHASPSTNLQGVKKTDVL